MGASDRKVTKEMSKQKKPARHMRSVIFDVVPDIEDKEEYEATKKKLQAWFTQYSAAHRHIFAVLYCAHMAAAWETIEKDGSIRLNLDHQTAEHYLTEIFNREKTNKTRDVLKKLYPDWSSDLYDRVWMRIQVAWGAKDAELNARRSWLTVNGIRGLNWFRSEPVPMRGNRDSQAKLLERGFRFNWDKKLGPMNFKIIQKTTKSGRAIDPYRWVIWRKLRDGQLKRGDIFLHCRDKNLTVRCCYEVDPIDAKIDPERVMEVAFTDRISRFIEMRLREGHRVGNRTPAVDDVWSYGISCDSALNWVKRHKMQQDANLAAVASCGKNHEIKRGEGNARAAKFEIKKMADFSRSRNGSTKSWNGFWTNKIIKSCERRGCGTLMVFDIPMEIKKKEDDETKKSKKDKKEKNPEKTTPRGLFGYQWPWWQFKQSLEYKCKQRGISLSFQSSPEVLEKV